MGKLTGLGDTIFTTGAFLYPFQKPDGTWGWAVAEFEDSCFLDGEEFNPPETADTFEELGTDTTEDW